MINVSTVQLLDVWSDLEAAYYGENGYGGDTAEIYAYRLEPHSPRRNLSGSEMKEEADREAAIASAKSLYEILKHFEQVHDDCIVFVEDRRVGDWILQEPFVHRCHVRIERKAESKP